MATRARRVDLLGLAVATFLAPPALLAGCGEALRVGGAGISTAGANRGVFTPGSVPYGKTYGQWGDRWWQWFVSIPVRDNPVLDETGEKADVGQSGPVWFLAGTVGASVERTCTIPAGKAIFFPIVCTSFWIPNDADTVAGIRALAKAGADSFTELEAAVDGVELQNLWLFRFQSPSTVLLTFPSDDSESVFPGTTGTHEAYNDGYWVMLEPLAVGHHTVRFGGKSTWAQTFPIVQAFEVRVTYHLTVQ